LGQADIKRSGQLDQPIAALFDRPQPVGFVFVGIITGRRRDQLRAFPAEVIETMRERLAKISARAPSLQPSCASSPLRRRRSLRLPRSD